MNTNSQLNKVIYRQFIDKNTSITSDIVIQSYNDFLADIQTPEISDELISIREEQQRKEEDMVNTTSICDWSTLGNIRDNIMSLNGSELKQLVNDNFYDENVMKGAMCTVDSIFYSSPYDTGSLYLNNRIRLYIENLRKSGPYLVSDFENAKDMFFIKYGKEVLHELIVGLFGTNKLRKHIPNFAYVYGGFKCSPPIIDQDTQEVLSWCLQTDNPVGYVLYENINPHTTMDTYIKRCTGKEFTNIYLQLIYSLRLASQLIDYTHYDLNHERVLLRTIPKTDMFQIKYETERGIEYITTHMIPTIINYSYSHIKTSDIYNKSNELLFPSSHLGKSDFVQLSIFPYTSWIFHDIYKFLMFSTVLALKYNNMSVLDECTKIFRFFNHSEDILSAIDIQLPVFFSLPLVKSTSNLSIDDLCTYIRTVCNCDFISSFKSNVPLLNCEELCMSEDGFYTRIGLKDKLFPDNILEFYDISVRLQNENRIVEKERIKDGFNYDIYMHEHLEVIRSLYEDITYILHNIKYVDLGDLSTEQIMTYNTLAIVKSLYTSIVTLIDKVIQLRFYKNVGIAVATEYQDNNSIEFIRGIMFRYDKEVIPKLRNARLIINKNHDILNGIMDDSYIRKDKRLEWYWNNRKDFDITSVNVLDNIEYELVTP
jgi:hypothetical protein